MIAFVPKISKDKNEKALYISDCYFVDLIVFWEKNLWT